MRGPLMSMNHTKPMFFNCDSKSMTKTIKLPDSTLFYVLYIIYVFVKIVYFLTFVFCLYIRSNIKFIICLDA